MGRNGNIRENAHMNQYPLIVVNVSLKNPKIQTLLQELKVSFWFEKNYHNEVVSTHGKDGYGAKMLIVHTTQWPIRY